MYKVKLTTKAEKELKRLSRENKLSISEIIDELKEDPLIGKPLDRELIRRFSYRVGAYRIIYKVNQVDRVIDIISTGHRSKIYN